jgi:hypothetical protein
METIIGMWIIRGFYDSVNWYGAQCLAWRGECVVVKVRYLLPSCHAVGEWLMASYPLTLNSRKVSVLSCNALQLLTDRLLCSLCIRSHERARSKVGSGFPLSMMQYGNDFLHLSESLFRRCKGQLGLYSTVIWRIVHHSFILWYAYDEGNASVTTFHTTSNALVTTFHTTSNASVTTFHTKKYHNSECHKMNPFIHSFVYIRLQFHNDLLRLHVKRSAVNPRPECPGFLIGRSLQSGRPFSTYSSSYSASNRGPKTVLYTSFYIPSNLLSTIDSTVRRCTCIIWVTENVFK